MLIFCARLVIFNCLGARLGGPRDRRLVLQHLQGVGHARALDALSLSVPLGFATVGDFALTGTEGLCGPTCGGQ
jgi:hypothetical protein